ncbi:MAG: hypothetical protein ABI910_22145, partial [Gemmatimonadota bacterium]
IPKGLKRAAEVRFVGHEKAGAEGTSLHFEVPRFGDVAGDLFERRQLWDDGPKPEETAFELLGAALHDVQLRRVESSRFDPMLLMRFRSYGRIIRRGRLDRIVLVDADLPQMARFDAEVVGAAHELSDVTPKPRRVRVRGRLDVLGASQGILKLQVESGGQVTARWEGEDPIESLAPLFNRDVVCEGMGVFRPSGSLLRIDADALGEAGIGDRAFTVIPRAIPRRDVPRDVRLRAGEPSVYRQFIGSIPAEEGDDEFAVAVEARISYPVAERLRHEVDRFLGVIRSG